MVFNISKKLLVAYFICSLFLPCLSSVAGTNTFLTLCYHDVPAEPTRDPYAVDVPALVDQIEYMRLHGYTFIGPSDIKIAATNSSYLPEKSVLLTFDDGYTTFQSNVVEILELYDCPAVLAICASWIDKGAPEDIPAPLMNWDQIRKVISHPLVSLASHSYDLHKAVRMNPQGNTGQAATTRMYRNGGYETGAEYRARIRNDHRKALDTFEKKLGMRPQIMVWPYGQYTRIAEEEAAKLGFDLMFTLETSASDANRPHSLARWMIIRNPDSGEFVESLKMHTPPQRLPVNQMRAIQADLDLIYDKSGEQTEKNLGRFLDRMVEIRPNAVFLQAFADPDGDGNVDSVYFPNRVLPMRSDLLCRVANQLYVRGFKVYIWMPVLSVVLPDGGSKGLRVLEWNGDRRTKPTTYWYDRLSPFSPRAAQVMSVLYEDMAAHVRFHGVLFQDDAYLGENEDAHPEALKVYARYLAGDPQKPSTWSDKDRKLLVEIKTKQLNAFTKTLMSSVKRYRPEAEFMRNIYAPVSLHPERARKFAQDYESALQLYDYVVVMAYPELGGVENPLRWLEEHVNAVRKYPGALDKTVFKIQSYDWKTKNWINAGELTRRIRRLVASGAKHVAYYPDDYTVNMPELDLIRTEMSTKITLFEKPPKSKVTKQY